jgi:predicted lipoprotein with Yx(FWY)xxD motif
MKQAKQNRQATRRVPFASIAAAAMAIGGFSASVFVVNTASAATSRAARTVVVSTVPNATFGKILVSGKTLYTLKPSKTACTAQCAKIWPALVLPKGMTKPKAGNGLSASKLGTVKRKGGVRQVTYSGKALYWFSGDTSAGQVNGNVTDEWGKWTVVVVAKPAQSAAPAPTSVTTIPAPSPAGTSAANGKTTTPPTSPSTTTPTTSASRTTTPTPPPTTTPPTSPPTTTTPPTSPPTTTTTTTPGSGGGVGF